MIAEHCRVAAGDVFTAEFDSLGPLTLHTS